MARSWGDGTVTQQLHELAFDMYEEMSGNGVLGVESYRKLLVLSVAPGPNSSGKKQSKTNKEKNLSLADLIPGWLDGSVGWIRPMGSGDDTAQVTPKEFVEKMMEYVNSPDNLGPGVKVVLGRCTGIECKASDVEGSNVVRGVRYVPTSSTDEEEKETTLPANDVIVAAGPWACQAEQWFEGALQLPMEGVKSTNIVWKPPVDENGNAKAVDATALFCGEDNRFGTHCKYFQVAYKLFVDCMYYIEEFIS